MFRKCFALSLVLFLSIPMVCLHAERSVRLAKAFSIEPSKDWLELPLPLQGVVVSYGKKGTLATFHITERELDDIHTVENLKWEDLFSPQFGSIDIRTQGMTVLGGEKAKFCIYLLKPGEFKKTMEGKLPAKYINYILIHGGKLFSVTFKDTDEGFVMNYPAFLAAIRTLRFDAPDVANVRKTT